MQAVEDVPRSGRIEQLASDFNPDMVGRQQVTAGAVRRFRHRQHGGQHRSRGMDPLVLAGHRLQRIVVVVGMHGRAVYQRREAGRKLDIGPDDRGTADAVRGYRLDDLAQNRDRLRPSPRQRRPEHIEDRLLAEPNDIGGNLPRIGLGNERSDLGGQGRHEQPSGSRRIVKALVEACQR